MPPSWGSYSRKRFRLSEPCRLRKNIVTHPLKPDHEKECLWQNRRVKDPARRWAHATVPLPMPVQCPMSPCPDSAVSQPGGHVTACHWSIGLSRCSLLSFSRPILCGCLYSSFWGFLLFALFHSFADFCNDGVVSTILIFTIGKKSFFSSF